VAAFIPEDSMKRIEKSAAPQIENTEAENTQAQWAEAWTQQLNRSGEIYGRLFASMRDEIASFMQKRLEANMEIAQAWTACRSVNEALELQQTWLRCAVEQYGEEGAKMSELCRGAVFQGEPESIQHATEPTPRAPEAPKVAHERKPVHVPVHTHVQHAAE
jgi:hypothetical protein